MLKLYRFPGATCAGKVLIALAEKDVTFDDTVLTREDLVQDWYRALNPLGVVPTIVHDEQVVTESSVILHYIEDAFPGPTLRPDTPLARARMNHWLKRADDTLNSLGTVTYAVFMRQVMLQKSQAELAAYFAAIPEYEKRERLRSVIELGLASPLIPAAVEALVGLQRHIEAAVTSGGYLAGDYSLADAAITPFVDRIANLSLLAGEEEMPSLHRWWSAIRARPSYEVAIGRPTPPELIASLRAAAAAQAGQLSDMLKAAMSR